MAIYAPQGVFELEEEERPSMDLTPNELQPLVG